MTDDIGWRVPADAIRLRFVRSPGPGGQNVNKVATGVQMWVSLAALGLPDPVLARLKRLAGRRIVGNDELLIDAHQHRTQERNRADAMRRLDALIAAARVAPRRRISTRPSRAARQRRMDGKSHRGGIKKMRGRPAPND